MSYNYKTLEDALEHAASRLPLNIFGQLINQVEDVITNHDDGSVLEQKIYKMTEEYSNENRKPAFSLQRMQEKEVASA